MTKLRTISWFLLLVILLAALVSLTMAEEPPTGAERQIFQQEPLSGESLAQSSEEIQVELSTFSRHSLSLPAASINLSPAAEDASPEPADVVDSSIVEAPNELQVSLEPVGSTPTELQADFFESTPRINLSGRFVGLPQPSPSPSAVGETCKQLLVNTKLDAPGGNIAPWGILAQNVYASTTNFVSPSHSLFFAANDSGDTTPNIDIFGQAFSVPSNLTSVTVRYETASVDSDEDDYAGFELYTLDAGGNLDQFLGGWVVGESPDKWQTQILQIVDKSALGAMEGQDLFLGFYNETKANPPDEWVYFDDITFTACQEDAPDSYIIVKKQTDPAGASQKFTFDPDWGSSFQLSDGQSKTSPALSPGTYSVTEQLPSGWKVTATCDNGDTPDSISLPKNTTVTCTFRNVQEKIEDTCSQVLVNTKLDIDEFGDGTGSAEPWSIIIPRVYYTNVEGRAYDGYSLVLKDADDDPSPEVDMFAQGFLMPGNLSEIRIEYQRATLNTNTADKVFGQLYLLDDDWVLHWPNDKYFAGEWTVAESEGVWQKQIITADNPDILNKVSGKRVAILLFNLTDNAGAKEEVLFDNISLTACSKGAPGNKKVYMPSIMQKFGKAAGPICTPPNENPADQFHSNRGLVQTGANCNSTLSNVDRRDYYTFTPTTSGNHTLRLSKLPGGTEWAATIWLDIAKPTYAPGNSKAGICLTDQEGSGDKQVVCNLNKGTGYFVRIDSGSTPQAGGYTMRVTSP